MKLIVKTPTEQLALLTALRSGKKELLHFLTLPAKDDVKDLYHQQLQIIEVCDLVMEDMTGGIFTYKGDSRRSHFEKNQDPEDEFLFPGGRNFSISDSASWRILANPKFYHAQLLHKLYAQENKGHSYLYFETAERCDDEFFKQILAQRPPKNAPDAPDAPFEKWNAGTHDERCDDYFDCLKMFYVAKDFAKKYVDYDPNGDGWRKIMPWMKED